MLNSQAVGSTIVIAGPTAIGKTAVAIALASRNPGKYEIVSADSIQAYRRFDIGSAKPTLSERLTVPFHLVDVAEPDEDFTVVNYQSLAYAAMADVVARGRTPIIAGGTGLYIRSIISGLSVPLAEPDEELRKQYIEEAQLSGSSAIHQQLAEVDPESASKIHENDLRRIIRALEVFKLTGRSLSSWHREDSMREKGKPLGYFALNRNRDKLHDQIDRRAEVMFEEGIVDEVIGLRAAGYSPELKPMTALGYLQANLVVDGRVSITEARDLTKAATRQYARRQLIWFRGEEGVQWIDVEGESPESVADRILDCIGPH